MNKNISVWRGPKSPPTNYHVWIKDDNSINVYDKTEWKVTSYPELKDDLKLYILEQIETLKDGADYDIQAKELTKVTYAELKSLRDNGELVEGHLYRITDYEFTTVQTNTKSAGHVFDIIVLATSANELSHIARAIAHEGDTYFDGNDLGAWELLYDLDNDAEKYEWADAENGKGVIYRMIDEKRNDCPYDFKNALFYNYILTSNYYYTFSYVVSGKIYDGTVEKQVKHCHDNSIGVTGTNLTKKRMNMNVFRNISFINACHDNILGNNCQSNTFGYACYSNTLGNSCRFNILGNNCISNILGKNCYSNTFGGYCHSNTFGDDCHDNILGNNCHSNTFGYFSSYNTFVDGCVSNTFGANCSFNTFGYKVSNHEVNSEKTSITLNDEYFDDGSGKLVPVKHPDLSTQPSILPYKFMGQYVYEQLIPVKLGDRIVNCDFEVEYPMILSAGVFGFNSFKNVDIIATKSDALLLNTESELDGYINVKYTDGSQLLFSNGYGYGYENNNTESSSDLIDFGLSPDGTIYVYDPNTEVLNLYKSGEITQDSIPQNLPLKNIILDKGVTSIGEGAFEDCSSLTSITIPESVTNIGNYAFKGCNSLTSIIIPESVTSIKNYAFGGCSSLTSITIPKSVTCIEGYVFYKCSNLNAITIPESITSIGQGAFWYCESLTSINIPESVTSIGNRGFSDCTGLTAVHISNIEAWCKIEFGDSSSNPLPFAHNLYLNGELVTNLVIPESVTSIKGCTFWGCSSLISITIPESVTSIGNYAFHGCSSLATINIPGGVTSIGGYAFWGCSSLTSIIIPENSKLTEIGNTAFWGCNSLTSITIPNSVTSIGDWAFSYCRSLISITSKSITPPSVYTNTFTDVNKSIPVYVPAESVDTYKAAGVWKYFTNIQAI